MADKMAEGVAVSIMGFIIVFIVLLVIMGILSLFNLFAQYGVKKATQTTDIPDVPSAPPAEPENLIDDTQLIAVITAAIAAAAADENDGQVEGTDGLVIKSIRRANAWNKEALSQNTNF